MIFYMQMRGLQHHVILVSQRLSHSDCNGPLKALLDGPDPEVQR